MESAYEIISYSDIAALNSATMHPTAVDYITGERKISGCGPKTIDRVAGGRIVELQY